MSYAQPAGRGRRLAILGLAVALHLAAAYALLHARGPERRVPDASSVRAEILAPSPPAARAQEPAPRMPRVRRPAAHAPAPAPVSPASTKIEVASPVSEAPETQAPETEAPAAEAPRAEAPAAAAAPKDETPSNSPAVALASSCRKPEYPAASRRADEEGRVLLSFLVDVDGKVLESRVERSSGYQRLDEAARAALALCRFTPARIDGRPARAWASLQYVWRLE